MLSAHRVFGNRRKPTVVVRLLGLASSLHNTTYDIKLTRLPLEMSAKLFNDSCLRLSAQSNLVLPIGSATLRDGKNHIYSAIVVWQDSAAYRTVSPAMRITTEADGRLHP